jgi:hypothetical protein
LEAGARGSLKQGSELVKPVTPFPLKWEILVILGIFAVFEKYIF